jgi:hypothetical protein
MSAGGRLQIRIQQDYEAIMHHLDVTNQEIEETTVPDDERCVTSSRVHPLCETNESYHKPKVVKCYWIRRFP